MTTDAARWLLCRPHGGLNDTLGVIGRCWRYAGRFDRALVVDCRASHFSREFTRYFEPRASSTVRLSLDRRTRRRFDTLPCFPEVVRGRVGSYETSEERHETLSHLEWRLVVESSTRTSLLLDFNEDHPESLVVHEAYGGGDVSLEALARLRFTARTAAAIQRRLRGLDRGTYVGVHVRNTDLQSDYRAFFDTHAVEFEGRTVLVCSDDGAVLDHARARLSRSTVVTTSDVPHGRGVPYQAPFHRSRRAQRRIAVDALVDLVALAQASEVLSPAVVNRRDEASGFSVLAAGLAQRPQLVDELMRRAPYSGVPPWLRHDVGSRPNSA